MCVCVDATMLSPLDYVMLHLGSPGRYQLFLAFLIITLQLPISFTTNLWPFYIEEHPHRCTVTSNKLRNNWTEADWIPGTSTGSSCAMYVDPADHRKGAQPCLHGHNFRPPHGEINVVTEFQLVCERQHLATITSYMTLAASMAGALLFGVIADHFERKWTLLLALYMFMVAAFSLHFVQDFASFAVCYTLQCFFISVRDVISAV